MPFKSTHSLPSLIYKRGVFRYCPPRASSRTINPPTVHTFLRRLQCHGESSEKSHAPLGSVTMQPCFLLSILSSDSQSALFSSSSSDFILPSFLSGSFNCSF